MNKYCKNKLHTVKRKKSFANYLLCHSLQENFHNLGNLIYKNSGQDKKCKKAFTNASRSVKFVNFFFRRQFSLNGILLHTLWYCVLASEKNSGIMNTCIIGTGMHFDKNSLYSVNT